MCFLPGGTGYRQGLRPMLQECIRYLLFFSGILFHVLVVKPNGSMFNAMYFELSFILGVLFRVSVFFFRAC